MKYVEIEELADIALGAAILGSGGGGSADYDVLMAEKHAMDYGRSQLISVDELKDDDFVVPIAFAGAPLVSSEQLPSGLECESIIHLIEDAFGIRPTHIMPAEIGGANALCPFLFASRLNIPILDADTIGRAFPELQMSSCNLHGVSASPAFIADAVGNSVIIKSVDAASLESIARQAIVAMGSSALVGIYLMDGIAAKRSVISGSLSYAMRLGKAMRCAKIAGKSPLEVLQREHGARLIGIGIIENIIQSIEQGFLTGSVAIATHDGSLIDIAYQNEYLKAELDGKVAGCTPEIIVVIDSESGLPITSEKLLFGLRVAVCTLPAPSVWTTESGLQLVGPDYFGYQQRGVKTL